MTRKKTNEEFIEEVYELVGEEYTFIEEYINTDTKIKVKHNTCDTVYSVSPNKFFNGRRCPECRNKRLREKNAWSHTRFLEEVERTYGDEYSVVSQYINMQTLITVKHLECGNIFNVKPQSFLKGKKCELCYRSHNKTPEFFKKEFESLVKDEYSLLSDYSNNKTKINVRHNTCGSEYLVDSTSFLDGRRCPICAIERKKIAKEEVQRIIDLKFGESFVVVGEVDGTRNPTTIKHIECGREFKIKRLDSFLYGAGSCKYCKASGGERKIGNWLEDNCIDYIAEYKIPDCKNIHPLPFDFAVLDENKNLFCLIEFDGKQHFEPIKHFGGEEGFKLRQMRDRIKNEYCKSNNIKLIRIPYWEFEAIEIILHYELEELKHYALFDIVQLFETI